MKLYLREKEVAIEELKEALDNLETCGSDGGDFDLISLEEIDQEGNLHFEISGCSTY